MQNKKDTFVLGARVLHWIMAVLVIAMVFIGLGIVTRIDSMHATLLAWHRPIGVLILLLAVARLVIRRRNLPPALPADLPKIMRKAALGSHIVLYALLFLQPISGWAMVSASGVPVELTDGVYLPQVLPENALVYAWLRTAHGLLAMAFYAMILMHVGAALFHALIRRDGVMRSMIGSKR